MSTPVFEEILFRKLDSVNTNTIEWRFIALGIIPSNEITPIHQSERSVWNYIKVFDRLFFIVYCFSVFTATFIFLKVGLADEEEYHQERFWLDYQSDGLKFLKNLVSVKIELIFGRNKILIKILIILYNLYSILILLRHNIWNKNNILMNLMRLFK